MNAVARYAGRISPGDWDTCYVAILAQYAIDETKGKVENFSDFASSLPEDDPDDYEGNITEADLAPVRAFWDTLDPDAFQYLENVFENERRTDGYCENFLIDGIVAAFERLAIREEIDNFYPLIRPVLKQVKKRNEFREFELITYGGVFSAVAEAAAIAAEGLATVSKTIGTITINWGDQSPKSHEALSKVWGVDESQEAKDQREEEYIEKPIKLADIRSVHLLAEPKRSTF